MNPEQAYYEAKFLEEKRAEALQGLPIFEQVANAAAPPSARSALDVLATLPPSPRRDANGRIVAPIPYEAGRESQAEPAPEIALARLDASLTAMTAEIAALRREVESLTKKG